MKTKYILHGGAAQLINKENDPFYAEILKGTPHNLTVLFVYFGDDPQKNEPHMAGNVAQFDRVKGNKKIMYEIATEEDFINQIEKSDVIYIRGGKTGLLMSILSKFDDLQSVFLEKIVSGESAGMNALSTYCYSKSSGLVKGLGILPIKTIPHFDGKMGVKALGEVALDLESCYLPEFKYKVFYSENFVE